MRALSKEEIALQEILHRGGVWTVSELADEVGVTKSKLRRIVKGLRRKFYDNHTEVALYIFTTKGGYTIDDKAENVMYEARMRLAMGTGVLLNGVYVFKRGKTIAARNFSNLKVEYRPKMLTIGKLL